MLNYTCIYLKNQIQSINCNTLRNKISTSFNWFSFTVILDIKAQNSQDSSRIILFRPVFICKKTFIFIILIIINVFLRNWYLDIVDLLGSQKSSCHWGRQNNVCLMSVCVEKIWLSKDTRVKERNIS